MAELVGRALVEAHVYAIEERDFDALEALVADDYVEAMPQSGERIRGRANQQAILRAYPGGVGDLDPSAGKLVGIEDRWVQTSSPAFTVLRIEGSDDVYTYVGTLRYASGDIWKVVVS